MNYVSLFMRDIEVLSVNYGTFNVQIFREDLLPYQLRGRLPKDKTPQSKLKCIYAFEEFLARRVLSLSRKNAKKILNLLHLSQVQDTSTKAKIALLCRAVSLEDNYWIKTATDKVMWKDVNLRSNSLNRVVAQVALHGTSLTLQGELTTPEITTMGAYAKCWKRIDKILYLYKAGETEEGKESKVEIEVSRILDKTNVKHIEYSEANSDGLFCCKCPCMTTDNISRLSGEDFISYCNVNGKNPLQEILSIDSQSIYLMCIVDYLISNRDRHSGNWGFYYSPDTMQIVGCHPLFDHNNAFDDGDMKAADGGASLIFDRKSKKEVALYALKRCNIEFVDRIVKSDFYYKEHYSSFMSRVKDLGLV